MKARINHNLSDEDFESIIKALHQDIKSKKKIRLPAVNPAQAHLSKEVVKLYEQIMIDSLSKEIVKVLKREKP